MRDLGQRPEFRPLLEKLQGERCLIYQGNKLVGCTFSFFVIYL